METVRLIPMRRAALQQSVFLYHNANLELRLFIIKQCTQLEIHRSCFFLLEVKQTSHETKPFVREFPPLSVTVGLAEPEEGYDTEANRARRRQVIM
jgi:hypothetical protein